MRVSRRALGLTLSTLVVAALGGFTFLQMRANQQEGRADTPGTPRVAEAAETDAPRTTDVAIPVQGAEVVLDTLVVSVTATGEAAAWQQAILSTQVAGRVARLAARESERVGSGQVVVGIEADEYRLALADAQARMRQAEATFREQTLFDDRIADAALRAERQRTARAKSGLEQAELAVQKAELDLRRTTIPAPFTGRLANLKVVPGQHVPAGAELATVVDLDPIKVEVQVLESEVSFLSGGRRAMVTFAAFPGEVFSGTIQTINPVVDPRTRTARVTVLVPNGNGRILPGMYARVSLEARRFPDRVIVPRAAVLERDRRTMVFVFENGEAKWRYVTTGLGNATHVEIVEDPETQGVQPGETVLTDGHFTLTDGARVRIVDNARLDEGRRP